MTEKTAELSKKNLLELKKLIHSSKVLDSTPISEQQRAYKEPFAIDTMRPEQWLYYIYIDYALEMLEKEFYEFFLKIEGISYFFVHTYGKEASGDHLELINLMSDFENNTLKLLKAKGLV